MWWKAVVFDLDDTLYPERQYVTSGMRAVAAWIERMLGFPAPRSFEELCELSEAAERGRTFDRWIEAHGLDPRVWISRMVQVYRCHSPQIQPYPDVVPVLQRLASCFGLGLVSDGYLETQRKKWDALNLAGFFQVAVFTDELGREHWKPSPLPFRTVLDRLAVPAERSVYIGDNPHKDFCGARRIGMGTIRLRRCDGLHCDLHLPGADNTPDAETSNLFDIEFQLARMAANIRTRTLRTA